MGAVILKFMLNLSLLIYSTSASGLHRTDTSANGEKTIVYRVSFKGQSDFELLQGSDPCMSIKFYCLNFNESSHYKACFDTLHARVSMQLGYHWSFVHRRLEVSENLFIDCSKISRWMVSKPKIETELDFNLVQELLDHITILMSNNSFTEKEIAYFDSQTNKMKLNKFQKFELYRKAFYS